MSEVATESVETLAEVLARHQYDPIRGWACTCGELFADQMDFTRPRTTSEQFVALLSAHQSDALLASDEMKQHAAEVRAEGQAQAVYDAEHDPRDHHCLADPCRWHPGEQRIRPMPSYPAVLAEGGGDRG